MKNLNEIRVMQELSIKKKIPVSSVPDKYKKVYRQLHSKGLIMQENNFWRAVEKNLKTE